MPKITTKIFVIREKIKRSPQCIAQRHLRSDYDAHVKRAAFQRFPMKTNKILLIKTENCSAKPGCFHELFAIGHALSSQFTDMHRIKPSSPERGNEIGMHVLIEK